MQCSTGKPARDGALFATCRNNLKLIYNSLQLYCQDNDDFYPSNDAWNTIFISQYIKDKSILKCPIKYRYEVSCNDNYSYNYRGAGKKAGLHKFLLLEDKEENHLKSNNSKVKNMYTKIYSNGDAETASIINNKDSLLQPNK